MQNALKGGPLSVPNVILAQTLWFIMMNEAIKDIHHVFFLKKASIGPSHDEWEVREPAKESCVCL